MPELVSRRARYERQTKAVVSASHVESTRPSGPPAPDAGTALGSSSTGRLGALVAWQLPLPGLNLFERSAA